VAEGGEVEGDGVVAEEEDQLLDLHLRSTITLR